MNLGPIALKERCRKNYQWSNIIFYFSAIPTRRKGDKEVQFDTPFSKRYCVPCSAEIRWLRRNIYKFYYFTFISPWRRPDSSLQELNMISLHYECFVPRYTETGPVVLEKCIKDIILLRFGKGHCLAVEQIWISSNQECLIRSVRSFVERDSVDLKKIIKWIDYFANPSPCLLPIIKRNSSKAKSDGKKGGGGAITHIAPYRTLCIAHHHFDTLEFKQLTIRKMYRRTTCTWTEYLPSAFCTGELYILPTHIASSLLPGIHTRLVCCCI